jgi:transposase-like protein
MEQIIKKPKKAGKRKRSSRRRYYSPSYKIRTIKLHLEGGVPLSVITEESGVCSALLCRWRHNFRLYGEDATLEALQNTDFVGQKEKRTEEKYGNWGMMKTN